MRKIGSLSKQLHANRFRDYLLTQQIHASIESNQDSDPPVYDIWVREEERTADASEAFLQFQQAPEDDRFDVAEQAEKIRQSQIQSAQRHKRLQRKMPTEHSYFGIQNGPIYCTIGIIIASVLASLGTDFIEGLKLDRAVLESQSFPLEPSQNRKARIFRTLSFVNIYHYDISANKNHGKPDPFASIRKGQVWRLITPMFLHGDEMHLAFNMMLIFFLGSVIERIHGFYFMLVLVLFSQIAAFLLQVLLPSSLGGTPLAIGASGVGCGVFGYLWIRPLLDSNFPIRLPQINVVMMLGFLVVCMLPGFPIPIANGAHVGGLIAGCLAAPVALLIGR